MIRNDLTWGGVKDESVTVGEVVMAAPLSILNEGGRTVPPTGIGTGAGGVEVAAGVHASAAGTMVYVVAPLACERTKVSVKFEEQVSAGVPSAFVFATERP